ncbi:MAG TPA: serine/threonine-protein kinase [Sphingomonadaceae bacterium]|nr:serine/threonine-protein kinase [Sphingomonadaceae bacterium]
MSKAYSNKALPAGTILREWRLEQVLGVGGFGIVYKGRGIYFDELVAIKEYFPSSISERDEDATVVPIDSDAEEVHALGLKKFVEEAKLLWNLSTPTRHPNIVSVRSLFEIHGTAYMVMDFEDGVSLSRLLKQGTSFNEQSLTALIRPIAEGLERAHRVGVLHRDIKPPNILVNDDGRPVLIDFGSARFESGEATSTKVTFHTPPYAAIEQYVKTYDQGPWTDVYALGVVLYECITGEKPPEVLERMHGGLGKPLADGDWPGYSRKFLRAVDAAMTIKPGERPQSISQWLELFDREDDGPLPAPEPDAEDEDATRVSGFVSEPQELVPVNPPAEGIAKVEQVDIGVPDDPREAKFKRAGQDTSTGRKTDEVPPPPQSSASASDSKAEQPKPAAGANAAATPPRQPAKPASAGAPARKLSPMVAGGAALALVAAVGGGWYFSSNASSKGGTDDALLADDGAGQDGETVEAVETVNIEEAGGVAQALQGLADEARRLRAPAAALKRLTDAGPQLATLEAEWKALTADPSKAAEAKAKDEEMGKIARTAAGQFAAALASDADGRARRLAADQPWADPRNPAAAAGATAERQKLATQIRGALGNIRASAASAAKAPDTAQSLTFARQALAHNGAYNAAIARAYRTKDAGEGQASASASSTGQTAATSATSSSAGSSESAASITETARITGRYEPANDGQKRQLKSAVDGAKDISKQVIRLADRNKPGANATPEQKEGYRVRQANAATARDYESYLDSLSNSMRGARSRAEADQLIAQANQTKGYLSQLLSASKAAN